MAFRFPSFGRLSASEEETRDAQLVSYARHKSKLQMVAAAMAVMDKTAAAEAAANAVAVDVPDAAVKDAVVVANAVETADAKDVAVVAVEDAAAVVVVVDADVVGARVVAVVLVEVVVVVGVMVETAVVDAVVVVAAAAAMAVAVDAVVKAVEDAAARAIKDVAVVAAEAVVVKVAKDAKDAKDVKDVAVVAAVAAAAADTAAAAWAMTWAAACKACKACRACRACKVCRACSKWAMLAWVAWVQSLALQDFDLVYLVSSRLLSQDSNFKLPPYLTAFSLMDYDGLDTFRFPPKRNAEPSFVLKVAKALVAMAKQDHLAGTHGQQTLMYLAKKETGIMLCQSVIQVWSTSFNMGSQCTLQTS